MELLALRGGFLNGGTSSSISIGGSGSAFTLPAISNNLDNLIIARPNVGTVPAVNLSADLTLRTMLNLTGGSIFIGNNNLTITTGANINSYNSNRFVVTNNNPASGGYLVQTVTTAASVTFPVGTSTYTPVIVDDAAGTTDNFRVRVFDSVFSAGTAGAVLPNNNSFVNKTWLVEEMIAGGSNATVTMQWNSIDENTSFTRLNSYITHYTGSGLGCHHNIRSNDGFCGCV